MNTRISAIMTHSPCTIHSNERLDKALHLFQTRRISILPVVNTQGCCVGVLTLKDLIDKQNELITESRARGFLEPVVVPDGSPHPTCFGDILVHDEMTDDFRFIHENSTVDECIDLLLEHHVHHLPVLNDDERLVGVVSTLDLIDYIRPYLEEKEEPGHVDGVVSSDGK